MRTFALVTLLWCAAALPVFAASIDGKWTSEMQVGNAEGKTYSHTSTFTFKSDGGVLTGTVVQRPIIVYHSGVIVVLICGLVLTLRIRQD